MTTAVVTWRPEPMNARLVAAAPPARQDFARVAQIRAPRGVLVQVSGDSVGTQNPVGTFFEFGTKPHEIEPKKKVLKLADGSFVSGPIQHPGMKAKPFLRPTLPLWTPLYQRRAAVALRGF
jgi:hypothetical protein